MGQVDKKQGQGEVRKHPKIRKTGDNSFTADVSSDMRMEDLMGMKTTDGANGVYSTAIGALGGSAERLGSLASAMFAELEPSDAVEAMLIAQMTATHVAMTSLSERVFSQSSYKVRESYERSVTRLSRTYLAQMDALKKYRAKAQQTVRVERVSVHEGGQAIVGDVSHAGGRSE
ncbi:hypothetical protein [Aliiroseovarius sp. F47248L]|uniref:hypothetical protein n=1 Tax=Aliiroseovarius sp. F47248L TaxID=2926420 RepID=UPI001FF67667|nr:hypothetical protein [Aliiroseovarius sp. F47248L]MCK0139270.1 hypothetical protein [Aliiroseovarius sp. F47248L]